MSINNVKQNTFGLEGDEYKKHQNDNIETGIFVMENDYFESYEITKFTQTQDTKTKQVCGLCDAEVTLYDIYFKTKTNKKIQFKSVHCEIKKEPKENGVIQFTCTIPHERQTLFITIDNDKLVFQSPSRLITVDCRNNIIKTNDAVDFDFTQNESVCLFSSKIPKHALPQQQAILRWFSLLNPEWKYKVQYGEKIICDPNVMGFKGFMFTSDGTRKVEFEFTKKRVYFLLGEVQPLESSQLFYRITGSTMEVLDSKNECKLQVKCDGHCILFSSNHDKYQLIYSCDLSGNLWEAKCIAEDNESVFSFNLDVEYNQIDYIDLFLCEGFKPHLDSRSSGLERHGFDPREKPVTAEQSMENFCKHKLILLNKEPMQDARKRRLIELCKKICIFIFLCFLCWFFIFAVREDFFKEKI